MDSSAVIRTWLLLVHFLFEQSFGLPYKIRIGAIFTGNVICNFYTLQKIFYSKLNKLVFPKFDKKRLFCVWIFVFTRFIHEKKSSHKTAFSRQNLGNTNLFSLE